MPCKLYGIIASGTPLIAIAPSECELSQLVCEEGIGFVAPPGEPATLASQIQQCAADAQKLAAMGDRARDLAVQKFDRRLAAERFAELIDGMLCDSSDPALRPAVECNAESLPLSRDAQSADLPDRALTNVL
jgi:hypothetical protein